MLAALVTLCKSFLTRVKNQLKKITKPNTATIAATVLSDLSRSKSGLIVENASLRQQSIVLKRQVERPQLTIGDRVRLVFMARLTHFWQAALHIVQPDTLLRWHRDLFRLYWKRKSKEIWSNVVDRQLSRGSALR